MRSRISKLVYLVPAVLLSACATNTPPHAYLPDTARDRIASTEIVMPIHQSEIYVYVPPSTAGASGGAGFGLLGALIGAAVDASINDARTSKAEAAVKPLCSAMVDYDFDGTMQGDVKTSVAPIVLLHVDNVRVMKETTPQSYDGALTGSKDGAVLFATTDYHLSNNGDVLYVTMGAALFPNSDALRAVAPSEKTKLKVDARNAIYRNTIAFQAQVPNGSATREINIAHWADNNGAAMRTALAFAGQKLSQLLADDLQATQAGDAAKTEEATKADGFEGHIVSSDADGKLVRFKDGTLMYYKK